MEHLKRGLDAKFQLESERKRLSEEQRAVSDLLLRSEGAVLERGRGLQEIQKTISSTLVRFAHAGFGAVSDTADEINNAIGAAMARNSELEKMVASAKASPGRKVIGQLSELRGLLDADVNIVAELTSRIERLGK